VQDAGVYFSFDPISPDVKRDPDDRLRPSEVECHVRTRLEIGLKQPAQQHLELAPEQERKDLWWLSRDGNDASEVAADIANAFSSEGVPWFERNANPQRALSAAERKRARHYDARAEAEARRIGRSLDRATWYDGQMFNDIRDLAGWRAHWDGASGRVAGQTTFGGRTRTCQGVWRGQRQNILVDARVR